MTPPAESKEPEAVRRLREMAEELLGHEHVVQCHDGCDRSDRTESLARAARALVEQWECAVSERKAWDRILTDRHLLSAERKACTENYNDASERAARLLAAIEKAAGL